MVPVIGLVSILLSSYQLLSLSGYRICTQIWWLVACYLGLTTERCVCVWWFVMESVYVTFHLPLLYWFLFVFILMKTCILCSDLVLHFPQFDIWDESIVFCQEYASNFLTSIGFTGLVNLTPIAVKPGNVKLFTVDATFYCLGSTFCVLLGRRVWGWERGRVQGSQVAAVGWVYDGSFRKLRQWQ